MEQLVKVNIKTTHFNYVTYCTTQYFSRPEVTQFRQGMFSHVRVWSKKDRLIFKVAITFSYRNNLLQRSSEISRLHWTTERVGFFPNFISPMHGYSFFSDQTLLRQLPTLNKTTFQFFLGTSANKNNQHFRGKPSSTRELLIRSRCNISC